MRELIDAALVAATLEFRRKECSDAGLGHFAADQPCTERNCVGVIVPAGKCRRERLRNLRAAAGRIAICRYCDADAGPADADPALRATIGNRLGQHRTKAGIIDAFVSVSSEVENVVPLLGEPGDKLVLQVDTCVVSSKHDAHAH